MFGQIQAGAEFRAITRKEDNADVLGHVDKDLFDLQAQGVVDGVFLVGTIQGQVANTIVYTECQVLVVAHERASSALFLLVIR